MVINQTIEDVKLTYLLPVYNRDNISHINDMDLHFSIDDDLFLEMLILKIRTVP